MRNPEGLFRPRFLTREGNMRLAEYVKLHPNLSQKEAREAFRKKFPSLWKASKFVHMSYVCKAGCLDHSEGGKQHRESTDKKTFDEAKGVRNLRVGAIEKGEVITEEIRVGELLQGLLDYAQVKCKESTYNAYRDIVVKHLTPFFAGFRAVDVCVRENIINRFLAEKSKPDSKRKADLNGEGAETYSKASINGMLTVLEIAFSLAKNRLPMVPNFSKYKFKKLDNGRKGYFAEAEFRTLCKHLPEDVRRPVQVLFNTGWRLMEVLSRKRAHVDLNKPKGKLILEPGETKNSEGRYFPFFTGELRDVLEEQEAVTKEFEKREGKRIPWLFHHEGEPLAVFYLKRGCWKPGRYFLKSWDDACKKAGLVGRLRHDFRRTFVRFADALPDHQGMKLSGHKSHAVYLAYKATNEKDIDDGALILEKARANQDHIKAAENK